MKKYKRIIYDHVPKCAGTFVCEYLKSHYCRDGLLPFLVNRGELKEIVSDIPGPKWDRTTYEIPNIEGAQNLEVSSVFENDKWWNEMREKHNVEAFKYYRMITIPGKQPKISRRCKSVGKTVLDDIEDTNVVMTGHYLFSIKEFTPRDTDFLFSWIRDPVDMFFSEYYFVNRKIKDRPECWPTDKTFPGWEMNTKRHLPMEEFVDWFIDEYRYNKSFFVRSFRDLVNDAYDFVGVSDFQDQSLRTLCRKLDMQYDPELFKNRVNSNGNVDTTYRRSELVDIFEEHYIYYNLIKKRNLGI